MDTREEISKTIGSLVIANAELNSQIAAANKSSEEMIMLIELAFDTGGDQLKEAISSSDVYKRIKAKSRPHHE